MTPPGAPPLTVIPDARFRAGAGIEALAEAAVAGGADAVQLRAKDLPDDELAAVARRVAALCRRAGRLFFVNDRPDIARACGADGVHVGPDDAAPAEARRVLGPTGRIGVSIYREEDLRAAEDAGAAYVAVGAVFPTTTKRIEVVGLAAVRRWRERTRLPIVAIGGIDARNAADAILAGADGVAVISAVSAAPDPEEATCALRAAVCEALSRRARP